MNKPELEKELNKLSKQVNDLKKDNDFLLREQKKYVKIAEKAGSELAPYKAMVLRLREEMTRLESLLNR